MNHYAQCPNCKEDTINIYICGDIMLPTKCKKCNSKLTAIIEHPTDTPAVWWVKLVAELMKE